MTIRKTLSSILTHDSFEPLLKLLQVLALAIGGGWILYNFFSFESSFQKMIIEEKKLGISKCLAGRVKYNGPRMKIDKLKEYGDGTQLFEVELSSELENISDKEFEISYAIISYYLGRLDSHKMNPDEIIKLNIMLDRLDSTEEEPITWKLIGLECFTPISPNNDYKSKVEHHLLSAKCEKPFNFGGLTGDIYPGEKSHFSYQYFIRAKEGQYIGFVVSVGKNGCTSNDCADKDIHNFRVYNRLDSNKKETIHEEIIPVE